MKKIDSEKLGADELLEILLEGNRCFKNNTPRVKNHCFDEMKRTLVEGQKPYAMILGCSDSRTCPEIIFDTGLGELFVARTAGGAIGPNVLETLEYGVAHLKIKLLVILGHQDCGVMKYAMNAPLYNDELENLICHAQCVKMQMGSACFNELAKHYCDFAKHRLLAKSHVIKEAYQSGALKIVKAYFTLENGEVEILE